MSENWPAIAAEVAAALKDVGFTATITRTGAPHGPEWNPTAGATTTHSIAVMQDTVGFGMLNGATINVGDVRLMAAAEATVPVQGDRISVSGKDYTIKYVEPFAPAGTVLFYDLILRN